MLLADSVQMNVILWFCKQSYNTIVSAFFKGHFDILPALLIDSFIFAIEEDFFAPEGDAIGVGLIYCNRSLNCWRIPSQSKMCSCLVIPIANMEIRKFVRENSERGDVDETNPGRS